MMGKETLSMTMFNSKVLVYQRLIIGSPRYRDGLDGLPVNILPLHSDVATWMSDVESPLSILKAVNPQCSFETQQESGRIRKNHK